MVGQRAERRRRRWTSCAARSRRPARGAPAGRRPRRLLGGVQDAGAEQVADVAGQRVDRPLVAVQGQRRVARRPGRRPRSGRGTARPARPRRPRQRVGARAGRTRPAGRRRQRRLVGVPLHLGQRDRAARPAGRRGTAPRRRSPSSPGWPGRGRCVSMYSTKPSPSASACAPSQPSAASQVRQQRRDLGRRHAPAPRVVQQADPQRGRVDRAVVGGRRADAWPPMNERRAGAARAGSCRAASPVSRSTAVPWRRGQHPQRARGQVGARAAAASGPPTGCRGRRGSGTRARRRRGTCRPAPVGQPQPQRLAGRRGSARAAGPAAGRRRRTAGRAHSTARRRGRDHGGPGPSTRTRQRSVDRRRPARARPASAAAPVVGRPRRRVAGHDDRRSRRRPSASVAARGTGGRPAPARRRPDLTTSIGGEVAAELDGDRRT